MEMKTPGRRDRDAMVSAKRVVQRIRLSRILLVILPGSDGRPREIDDCIGAIEGGPIELTRLGIPERGLRPGLVSGPCEHANAVAIGLEAGNQRRPDEPGSTRNEDVHLPAVFAVATAITRASSVWTTANTTRPA